MKLRVSSQRFLPSAINIVVCASVKGMEAMCQKHGFPCGPHDAELVVMKKPYYAVFLVGKTAPEGDSNMPHIPAGLLNHKRRTYCVSFEEGVEESRWVFALARELYSFDKYKQSQPVTLYVHGAQAPVWVKENDAINRVRDLENEPNNVINPGTFCRVARGWFKGLVGVRMAVLDEKALEKEGLGLVLAVGKGSNTPPRLLIIEYTGTPGAHNTIALVGKGITFDTGGLNLKTGYSIDHMHHDKSGASVCMGVVRYLAEMKSPLNVVALLPLADNAIGSRATKPHDVVKAYSGAWVEINDTDAEGRLVMADALAYVRNFKHVKWVIDVATLTGLPERLYPHLAAAYYTRDRKVSRMMVKLGEEIGEKVWPLPDWKTTEGTGSQIAEVRNYSEKRQDTYMAARFLAGFLPKGLERKWIHVDLAENNRGTLALGTGTRLLMHLLPRL